MGASWRRGPAAAGRYLGHLLSGLLLELLLHDLLLDFDRERQTVADHSREAVLVELHVALAVAREVDEPARNDRRRGERVDLRDVAFGVAGGECARLGAGEGAQSGRSAKGVVEALEQCAGGGRVVGDRDVRVGCDRDPVGGAHKSYVLMGLEIISHVSANAQTAP